jgi:Mg-chelatase subunit ChlD
MARSRLAARAVRVVSLLLALGAPATRAQDAILCTGTSPEGIEVTVRLDGPDAGTVVTSAPPCDGNVLVEGAATASDRLPPFDVYLIVDSSGSTSKCSGLDLDDDLVLGADSPAGCTDPDDSVLGAELAAVRGLLANLAGLDVRVSLIEFSAVIARPRPGEQGRIRVVQSLTSDFGAVRAGLDAVLAAGPAGATDYAGALDAARAEVVAFGSPDREPIAFFLTDGKPTFPRYPYDSTEQPDVDASLDAALRAAAVGLAVNTYEVGSFDDRGILAQIAAITGGDAVASLDPATLLQTLPEAQLTAIESVVVVNDTSGVSVEADVRPDGTFSASVPLDPDYNVLHVVVTPEGGTAFELDCSASVLHQCIEEGLCFRETTDELLQQLLDSSADLARQLGASTTCEALRGEAPGACAQAVREYLALALNVLDGRLTERCTLDVGPGLPTTVTEVVDLVRTLVETGVEADCAEAARIGAAVNSGAAVTQQPTPPPEPVECVVDDPVTGLQVTVTIDSPIMGDLAMREPCDGVVPVAGSVTVDGFSNLFDLFFVIDSSGSTSSASGRDIDQDGFLGTGPAYANTDLGDSVLEAELEAVRLFVADLDPSWARVALIQFSNPDNHFGSGELQRLVTPLTADFVRVEAGLQAISAGGSHGATDYGGALQLLEAEYLASADPVNRVPICFFLSDGIPTWPEPPFDQTQPPDRQAAIDGAMRAAAYGIQINTYEVGPAGASAILTEMADLTGGEFFAALVAGDIVQVLNEFNLVGIAQVVIENVSLGTVTSGTVDDDGNFGGTIALQPGTNEIRITVTTDTRDPVSASCTTQVELVYANLVCQPLNAATWAGECARPVQPEPSIGRVAAGAGGVGVAIEVDPVTLADGHRIYRGDLQLLRAGTYSHVSPFSGDPAVPECEMGAGVTSFLDAGALRDGRDYYYLVVALMGGVEGSHGRDERNRDGRGDRERPRPDDDPSDLVVNGCP